MGREPSPVSSCLLFTVFAYAKTLQGAALASGIVGREKSHVFRGTLETLSVGEHTIAAVAAAGIGILVFLRRKAKHVQTDID